MFPNDDLVSCANTDEVNVATMATRKNRRFIKFDFFINKYHSLPMQTVEMLMTGDLHHAGSLKNQI
ncbi:hypothetical protein GCM10023313_24480 [Mucilaginibacter defluvii]|uniref:Uncharacterized protein n=1 Tax=Mucilaginibacter defluvii TaxID=1196019 RepID=A0ABP9FX47_9SPHI